MKASTAKQVEFILRKYTKQLKEKEGRISVNEAGVLARLSSACHRLNRTTGGVVPKERDPLQDGDTSFYEQLAID